MCTVTYLPTTNGFYLNSNRDELISRSVGEISELKTANQTSIYFPKDPISGGSWMATSNTGRTAIVLNGAFKAHQRKANYAKSRGLILLEMMESQHLNVFFKEHNFQEIEPFTFVIFDKNKLIDFRWDGETKHFQELPIDKPIIWSSCMLYDELAKNKRKTWLEKWLRNYPNYTYKDVLYFHKYSGDGDLANDIQMKRGKDLRTISISSIIKNNNDVEIIHQDLIGNSIDQKNFTINI